MIRAIVSLLSLFSVFCSLLPFAFLVSCDEVSEVEVEQVERVLSANCDQLKIRKAYHRLDYGVVWIELDENPPRSFWDDLKASGWKWQESPEPTRRRGISYAVFCLKKNKQSIIEFINEQQVLYYFPDENPLSLFDNMI